ncbi:hypothetical protein PINS_up009188 [Pythium insidiosum]|nr:hypothetical protein PINS_up009188 [Pythium insidiosum]
MALTDADWPRYSFLAGATTAFARAATPDIEQRLLAGTNDAFTCETWLQLRPPKRALSPVSERIRHGGCWVVHTRAWALGLLDDGAIVVYWNGDWLVSSPGRVLPRRWTHAALGHSGAITERPVVLVENAAVGLTEVKSKQVVGLPVDVSGGFRVGWGPSPACLLLLHELRLWAVQLPFETIKQ